MCSSFLLLPAHFCYYQLFFAIISYYYYFISLGFSAAARQGLKMPPLLASSPGQTDFKHSSLASIFPRYVGNSPFYAFIIILDFCGIFLALQWPSTEIPKIWLSFSFPCWLKGTERRHHIKQYSEYQEKQQIFLPQPLLQVLEVLFTSQKSFFL